MYKHWPAKTVTEADDHMFCLITMNHHPLHINDVYAAQSQQGRNVVVGPLVYSLIARHVGAGRLRARRSRTSPPRSSPHPAPVFHGDTLFVESEVLEVTPSRSKPDRGVVKVRTDAYNQDGEPWRPSSAPCSCRRRRVHRADHPGASGGAGHEALSRTSRGVHLTVAHDVHRGGIGRRLVGGFCGVVGSG